MNRKKELVLKGWIAENGLNINHANGGILTILATVLRLIRKHQVQCENDCNGYGTIKGQSYHTGKIDDYARKNYGYNVKSGYVSADTDETVFYAEIIRIENRITHETGRICLVPEFQHDPRGLTVRLNREDSKVPCTYFGF